MHERARGMILTSWKCPQARERGEKFRLCFSARDLGKNRESRLKTEPRLRERFQQGTCISRFTLEKDRDRLPLGCLTQVATLP